VPAHGEVVERRRPAPRQAEGQEVLILPHPLACARCGARAARARATWGSSIRADGPPHPRRSPASAGFPVRTSAAASSCPAHPSKGSAGPQRPARPSWRTTVQESCRRRDPPGPRAPPGRKHRPADSLAQCAPPVSVLFPPDPALGNRSRRPRSPSRAGGRQVEEHGPGTLPYRRRADDAGHSSPALPILHRNIRAAAAQM
jgi:hypothetical protein